jgi:hypothetical protein
MSMTDNFPEGDALWDQVVLLTHAWSTYCVLYRSAEDAHALVDRSARGFFHHHRGLLSKDILLGIARLTENEIVGKHRHLVLAILLQDPALDAHPQERESLRARIAALVDKAATVRTHRHSYIAHLDHALATGATSALPLSENDVASLVEEAGAIFSAYTVAVGRDASLELVSLGDASHLLAKLADSEKWLSYRQHHLRTTGQPPPDLPATA